MSGYQDPYSGLFGEPGAWNWPALLFLAWAGLVVLIMFAIFIGFDNGGFLFRLDKKLGIRKVDRDPQDDIGFEDEY